jgi:hypothetical protein
VKDGTDEPPKVAKGIPVPSETDADFWFRIEKEDDSKRCPLEVVE